MQKLDPSDPRPPFRQVADSVRTAIRDGELKVDDKLPTYEGLASKFGVSVGTAKSAIGVLRNEGLITTVHGRGSYIRAVPAAEHEAGEGELTEIWRQLASLSRRLEAVERQLPGS